MSNEEIIEEILVESYQLGIADLVFEKFNEYIKTYDRTNAYIMAISKVKQELNITRNE